MSGSGTVPSGPVEVTISADTTISGSACTNNAANNITISGGVTVAVDYAIGSFPNGWEMNDLTVDGTINHTDGDTDGVMIKATGFATIGGTGLINADWLGHGGGAGAADGGGDGGGTQNGGGGGFGGDGGDALGGSAYGSLAQPDDLGSAEAAGPASEHPTAVTGVARSSSMSMEHSRLTAP